MGIVLKVTPDVLTKMADDIDSQIQDIQAQFDLIDTEIRRTGSCWEGDASDAHRSKYDALKDEIYEALNHLKNHPVNLLQMAGLYEKTESDLQEAAQSLQEDVIV